jgi:hypothetical protein
MRKVLQNEAFFISVHSKEFAAKEGCQQKNANLEIGVPG